MAPFDWLEQTAANLMSHFWEPLVEGIGVVQAMLVFVVAVIVVIGLFVWARRQFTPPEGGFLIEMVDGGNTLVEVHNTGGQGWFWAGAKLVGTENLVGLSGHKCPCVWDTGRSECWIWAEAGPAC